MSSLLQIERHATTNQPIRFVIFVSYGNDSIALIQWAHEQELEGVVVVFTDTGWMADGWAERVDRAEAWVRRIGFTPYRTSSIGFRQLARDKKGIPTQRYQWCSFVLKIEPGMRWLAENDPDARAVCLVGVRREESSDRADFPAYLLNSANHGHRVMVAPFADMTEAERDVLIRRAGFEPLPHRSRECRCINSNRNDMRRFTDADWQAIAEVEVSRLTKRVEEAAGVLKPISDRAFQYDGCEEDWFCSPSMQVKHLRAARDFLQKNGGGNG